MGEGPAIKGDLPAPSADNAPAKEAAKE